MATFLHDYSRIVAEATQGSFNTVVSLEALRFEWQCCFLMLLDLEGYRAGAALPLKQDIRAAIERDLLALAKPDAGTAEDIVDARLDRYAAIMRGKEGSDPLTALIDALWHLCRAAADCGSNAAQPPYVIGNFFRVAEQQIQFSLAAAQHTGFFCRVARTLWSLGEGMRTMNEQRLISVIKGVD